MLESKSIIVDVFSSPGPEFPAPLLRVVLVVRPALYCFQARVLRPVEEEVIVKISEI